MDTIKTPTVIETEGTAELRKVLTYARAPGGLVDTKAYVGLKGCILIKNLSVDIVISDARIRYGHLDLYVTPVSGTGAVWVERKNIKIDKDPAFTKRSTAWSLLMNLPRQWP